MRRKLRPELVPGILPGAQAVEVWRLSRTAVREVGSGWRAYWLRYRPRPEATTLHCTCGPALRILGVMCYRKLSAFSLK